MSELPIKRSETIGALVAALAAAQQEFPEIQKNRENTYNHTWYADLADVIAATRPFLAKNGLVVIQAPVYGLEDRKTAGAFSLLAHSSGEFISTELILPAEGKAKDGILKLDAQTIAAAITYAKRYTWQALVGVAAEEDDDAQTIADRSSDSRPTPDKPKTIKAPAPNQTPAKTGGERPNDSKPPQRQVSSPATLGAPYGAETKVTTVPALPSEPVVITQPTPKTSNSNFNDVTPIQASFPLQTDNKADIKSPVPETKRVESASSEQNEPDKQADTSALPVKSQFDTYVAKVRDEVKPALEKAGLKPSKGLQTGAKLKNFILSVYGNPGAKELTDLTIKQWDAFLAAFASTDSASFALKVEEANKK